MQETTPLKLEIAGYKILPIPTGLFGLDGGAMFGTVPRVIWEKTNPPDEKNRIAMEARALLLLGEKRRVLVDTGNGGHFIEKYGEKLGAKFAEIYGVQSGGPTLESSLKTHGLSTGDITDVILTHLHFDHAGGSTQFEGGRIIPTFKNARYYVQRENLKTAEQPNLRERASYLPANFKPLLDAGVLELLDGPLELFNGVSLLLSFGHTHAQQLVKVSDSKNTLVYGGDLIPTSSHVRLPFVMGYDLDPLKIIDEKSQLLEQAAQGQWLIYFEHDPYFDAARIEKKDGDFRLKEKVSLQSH